MEKKYLDKNIKKTLVSIFSIRSALSFLRSALLLISIGVGMNSSENLVGKLFVGVAIILIAMLIAFGVERHLLHKRIINLLIDNCKNHQ